MATLIPRPSNDSAARTASTASSVSLGAFRAPCGALLGGLASTLFLGAAETERQRSPTTCQYYRDPCYHRLYAENLCQARVEEGIDEIGAAKHCTVNDVLGLEFLFTGNDWPQRLTRHVGY